MPPKSYLKWTRKDVKGAPQSSAPKPMQNKPQIKEYADLAWDKLETPTATIGEMSDMALYLRRQIRLARVRRPSLRL